MVTNYPPRTGGVEAHVSGLAGALLERGHRVTVITLDDTEGDDLAGGLRVVRLPRRLSVGSVLAFPPLGTARRIRELARESRAQVISTHTRFFPMSFVGVRVGSSLGIPVIHTEHGSGFVAGVSPFIALASRLVDLSMGRMVLRSASLVVGVSDSVARFVKSLSGVTAAIFPNAIDVDRWRSASEKGRHELSASSRLVFVGRLVPGKGWDTALRSAEILAAQGDTPPFELHICGDGPDRAALERLIERSPIRKSTVVHGRLDPAALAAVLRGSVLVNPTTLSEGFQTTLIEALACGARIVSRDVPGVRELRGQGASVTVVDSEDPERWATALGVALMRSGATFPADRLDEWSWSTRAVQYEILMEEAREVHDGRQRSRARHREIGTRE